MSGLDRVLVGDTNQATWVASGVTPTAISHAILSGSETVVSSITGTSSGAGHYYAFWNVNTPGYYVSEWRATVGGNPHVRRRKIKARLVEVD